MIEKQGKPLDLPSCIQSVLWSWRSLHAPWQKETEWRFAVPTRKGMWRRLCPISMPRSTETAFSWAFTPREQWPSRPCPSLTKASTRASTRQKERRFRASWLWQVMMIVLPKQHRQVCETKAFLEAGISSHCLRWNWLSTIRCSCSRTQTFEAQMCTYSTCKAAWNCPTCLLLVGLDLFCFFHLRKAT